MLKVVDVTVEEVPPLEGAGGGPQLTTREGREREESGKRERGRLEEETVRK